MKKKHTGKITTTTTKVLWVIVSFLVISILFYLFNEDRSLSKQEPITQSTIQLVGGNDFLTQFTQTPNAVLLDVRTPEEYTQGHIAQAVNMDFYNQSFNSQIKTLDKEKTYFVYCRSGNRSAQSVKIMKNAGIQNIVELQGGIVSSPELITQK